MIYPVKRNFAIALCLVLTNVTGSERHGRIMAIAFTENSVF